MSPSSHRTAALLLALAIAPGARAQEGAPVADRDWPAYGGDRGGGRYAPLAQVTRENVARLREAWRFSTGETRPEFATRRRTSFEATPLVVGGTMYLSTPLGRVFALDAATGRERWRYDARVPRDATFGDFTNRGLTYWVDERAAADAPCRARLFLGTIDARLVALDARTGRRCAGFGSAGEVSLREGLRNAPEELSEYELTSPPAVVNGVLVTGSAVADNQRTDAASGEVRGYDARTGALRWSWDPVARDGGAAADRSWRGAAARRTGAANTWSVIAADTVLGLVYVPTSSPSVDYYGGARPGDNRHASSIVALRAATGEVAWAFQTVHHDLWDYDNAAPPALVTVRREGREIPVVLQATKTGMLYVLDRATGVPIIPVEERPVPASTVPGEEAWPTQPFSTLPPLSPQGFRPDQAFGADSADRAACTATIAALRHEGIFTPPSLEGTLVVPSNVGGAHWGGVAFDPVRQLAIVPVNNVAAVVQLIPREQHERGTMVHEPGWEYAPMRGTPYWMRRRILLSPRNVPCTPPPFGSLVALNLETGAEAWRVPLGTPGPLLGAAGLTRDAAVARPNVMRDAMSVRGPAGLDSAAIRALGSPNLGGAIVTGGGLVFVAATLDRQLRAFDVETGRELWHAPLPAGGKATPMTYATGGRQYVAIAAGGDGDIFGKGDELVVFALPP
ncbi:MAG TPA: pyrroloquinoline quinone-dependent dehydrogenase, partial [Gemmatimonadaceae bacterium]